MNENNFNNQNNYGYQNGFTGQQVPAPIPQPEMPKKKKRLTAAVLGAIAAVVVVAGGAGFGGAVIASQINRPAVGESTSGSYSETSGTPTLNDLQQNVSSTAGDKRTENGVEFNSDGTYAYTRDLVNAVKDSIVFIKNYVDNGYQKGYAMGSGIIISTDGYIITNNHVISDGVEDCEITVNNTAADGSVTETQYKAKLIGTDERTDLAVLKIDAKNLTAAKLGDSDKLSLGDDIVIIGNPVLVGADVTTLDTSVSKGVVSGLNRELSATGKGLTSIQTDAAVNGGSSGGAMFNGYGEVVGIVDFKIVADKTENLGFGITINEAKQVVEDLIARGYVSGRPMLGIVYQNVTESVAAYSGMTPGLYVTEVKKDYPVASSDLVAGDTIVEIDGKSVLTNDISTILANKKPGDTITLVVVRTNGIRQQKVTISVQLGEDKGN